MPSPFLRQCRLSSPRGSLQDIASLCLALQGAGVVHRHSCVAIFQWDDAPRAPCGVMDRAATLIRRIRRLFGARESALAAHPGIPEQKENNYNKNLLTGPIGLAHNDPLALNVSSW